MAETDCVTAGWTLVEIDTGAMYPICVNNDCSDSLDFWQYVLSHFFPRTIFHQHLAIKFSYNLLTLVYGMGFPLAGHDQTF